MTNHTTCSGWAPCHPIPEQAPNPPADALSNAVAVYEYRDQNGRLSFIQRRFENEAGEKTLAPLCYGTLNEKTGWHPKWPGNEIPLFNIENLSNTVNEVIFVEGEKSCIAAKSLLPENTAITSFGAFAGLSRTDFTPLYGRKIIVLCDNDPEGEKYGRAVSRKALEAGATSVAVLLPDQTRPLKHDIADPIPEGKPANFWAQTIRGLQVSRQESGEHFYLADIHENKVTLRRAHPRFTGPTPTTSILPAQGDPELLPEALIGVSGKIVNSLYPHTESSKPSLLFQLLSIFVVFVGPSYYWTLSGVRQPIIEFLLMFGPTSTGRKGSSFRILKALFKHVSPEFVQHHFKSGISSGEGLIYQLRDGTKSNGSKGSKDDPGVSDKRLLINEEEFGTTLTMIARKGNSASGVLRQAWDGDTLSSLTKNDPYSASNPHLGLVAHITPADLDRNSSQTDRHNGVLNRFIPVFANRTKLLPLGGNISDDDLCKLAELIVKSVSRLPEMGGEICLSREAEQAFHSAYRNLDTHNDPEVGALIARGPAHVRRTAAGLALFDGEMIVDGAHMLAALAMWRYGIDSAERLVGCSRPTAGLEQLLRAINDKPEGISKTDIHKAFGNNKKVEQIDVMLNLLSHEGHIKRLSKHPEIWAAATPQILNECTKSTNSVDPATEVHHDDLHS